MVYVALIVGLIASQASGDTARATVLRAEAAVAGDSAAPVAAAWHARLAVDSTDRAAKLGLAALARLRYDTTEALRWVRSLVTPGQPPADRFATRALSVRAYVRTLNTDVSAIVEGMTDAAMAARALPDSTTAAEALSNLAVWRARQIGPLRAMALLDSICPTDSRGTRRGSEPGGSVRGPRCLRSAAGRISPRRPKLERSWPDRLVIGGKKPSA